MLKVNNKNNKTTSITSFYVFNCVVTGLCILNTQYFLPIKFRPAQSHRVKFKQKPGKPVFATLLECL